MLIGASWRPVQRRAAVQPCSPPARFSQPPPGKALDLSSRELCGRSLARTSPRTIDWARRALPWAFSRLQGSPSLKLAISRSSFIRRRPLVPQRAFYASQPVGRPSGGKSFVGAEPILVPDAVKSSFIQISAEERNLFEFLLEVLKKTNTQATLRVAGGWVRDKILKLGSVDIDIALDTMTGAQFAAIVTNFIAETDRNVEASPQTSIDSSASHKIGIVKLNPEKSKHLETAILALFGFEINLVQLRTDQYSSKSRIPSIQLGTASEDAFRRDLTINTLFYNINSDKIEDYTRLGLEHLRSEIIATPLPPKETLTDDPLRALRVIRFASRFGYELDGELHQVMESISPSWLPLHKVSPGRIGQELVKMLVGPNSVTSVDRLFDYKLIPVIFNTVTANNNKKHDNWLPWTEERQTLAKKRVGLAARIGGLLEGGEEMHIAKEELAVVLATAALLSPIFDYSKFKTSSSNICETVVTIFINSCLQWPHRYARNIGHLIFYSHTFLPIMASYECTILAGEETTDVEVLKKRFLDHLASSGYQREETQACAGAPSTQLPKWIRNARFWWPVSLLFSGLLKQPISSTLSLERAFVGAISATSLKNAVTVQPLLDGHEIKALLRIKEGKEVGEYMAELMMWQLYNIDNATKETATQFITQKQAQKLGNKAK